AQRISSQHNPALYLGAKTIIARASIHIGKRSRILRSKSITHAVKSRQVRGSLRGCDQVISWYCVFGVRQRNFYNLASEVGQLLNCSLNGTANFCIEAFA